jgi:hypothetical protein
MKKTEGRKSRDRVPLNNNCWYVYKFLLATKKGQPLETGVGRPSDDIAVQPTLSNIFANQKPYLNKFSLLNQGPRRGFFDEKVENIVRQI